MSSALRAIVYNIYLLLGKEGKRLKHTRTMDTMGALLL